MWTLGFQCNLKSDDSKSWYVLGLCSHVRKEQEHSTWVWTPSTASRVSPSLIHRCGPSCNTIQVNSYFSETGSNFKTWKVSKPTLTPECRYQLAGYVVTAEFPLISRPKNGVISVVELWFYLRFEEQMSCVHCKPFTNLNNGVRVGIIYTHAHALQKYTKNSKHIQLQQKQCSHCWNVFLWLYGWFYPAATLATSLKP